MAFIYEVNGHKVQFDHEPTEKDIDEAAHSLGPAPSEKPESRMPKPVEGEGGAAFGVYRSAGRRPESQNDREASKDMAVQTVRGIASNIPAVAGIPGSIVNAVANAPRTAQDISNRYQKAKEAFTGEQPQTQPLPEYNQVTPYDMSYFANLTPGPQPSSPAGQLAFGAGQMVGAPIVPPVMKAAAPVAKYGYELGKDVASIAAHPIQTGKTAMEAFGRGYSGKIAPGSEGSALVPIRDTYFPHEQVAEYQAGTRSPLQMNEVPTSDITQQNAINRFAYNMAPENAQGQKLVAPAGRGLEGYMENLGATYKEKPLMGALDIATTLGGIGPVSAMAKSIPAIAARQLTKATQFEPNFNAAAVHAAQGQAGLQANMPPSTLALPAPGPVNPAAIQMPGPQRNVNIEGQSFKLPSQINTANSQGARAPQSSIPVPKIEPVKPAETPKEFSQQMAQQKLEQGFKPVEPTPLSEAQPASVEQPAPQPQVRTPEQIRKELNDISTQAENLHKSGLEQGLQPGTPAGEAHQAKLGELYQQSKKLEEELKPEKKTTKKEQFSEIKQPISMKGSEGKVSFTHANADKSKLIGTLNDGTKVEVHTTKNPVEMYDISNPKKPVKIAEFGGGGKQTFGKPLPSKKGPSDISQMLTEDTIFNTKAEWEKANSFNTLAEKRRIGGYKENGKIIREVEPDYSGVPEGLRKELPKRYFKEGDK